MARPAPAEVWLVDLGMAAKVRPYLILSDYPLTEQRDADCAAKLARRTLTNLYDERPAWLANAHTKLDAAVAAACGWPQDLSQDKIRACLLELNFARAAAEKASVQKPAVKSRASREKTAEEML